MINKSLFLKINGITLGSVLVLILVGSIVRSTGAGMGCPDWPKCFGSYVPPTSADQLPDNYLEIFRLKRIEKNKRLASVLLSLGYEELGSRILNDPDVQSEHEFNVTKAWIEYVNRLVGVLIGFLVFLNMIWAFSIKDNRWVAIMGIIVFVLTGFQGWFGSLVVSTNLLKGFITIHMILALLIVAHLIWMNTRARNFERISSRGLNILSIGLLILLIPQIILGTEVRAVVDDLLVSEPNRYFWANQLTSIFLVHRSYSWLILVGSIGIYMMVRTQGIQDLKPTSSYLLLMVLGISLIGIVMSKFGFPVWAQPVHLLLAAGIFSVLFYLILRLKLS